MVPIRITTGKCSQSIVNDGADLVTKSCPTFCDLMDCSLPGSSVHGILQARILLEWVAISFSRGSSWPRNWTRVSCIAGRFFTSWATREALGKVRREFYEKDQKNGLEAKKREWDTGATESSEKLKRVEGAIKETGEISRGWVMKDPGMLIIKANIYWPFTTVSARCCSECLTCTNLILVTVTWSWHYDDPHFIDKETKVRRD